MGSQCDLENRRDVQGMEGEALAIEWGCSFYEASAKSGVNVNEVFNDLVCQIQQSKFMYNSYVRGEGYCFFSGSTWGRVNYGRGSKVWFHSYWLAIFTKL